MLVRSRANLSTVHRRYKRDKYKRVRTILRVCGGDEAFHSNPPSLAHADTSHANLLIQSKLSPPSYGPHEVIRATDTTSTISVDCFHESASLDRLALVPLVIASSDNARAKTPPYSKPSSNRLILQATPVQQLTTTRRARIARPPRNLSRQHRARRKLTRMNSLGTRSSRINSILIACSTPYTGMEIRQLTTPKSHPSTCHNN